MTKSARGLFRATGNKPKPVAVRDLLTGEYSMSGEGLAREVDEFYPTPPQPTRALLAAELPRLRDFGTIWEPACGDGAMVREMEALGLQVFASDLVDRGAGGLASFWQKYPPARVYLMRWKIDFTGQGAPPMLNGWFVWDKKHQGETVLKMLDRADARQGALFQEVA